MNNHWDSWRKVVYGGDSNNTCSCSDIFTIRFRSLYLARHPMKNIVEKVTGHIASQSTWKQSLINAIHHMNDMGIEIYSNFETLSRWHRKFALNRTFFSKPPDPKDARLCRFFLDNPDAMEAFKSHDTQNIKDLRVELMHEFVVDQLVPELVSRLKIEVDDGVTTTLTNEDIAAFSSSYGLTTLSITTISRWMHAVGFRYQNVRSITLWMVMRDLKQ